MSDYKKTKDISIRFPPELAERLAAAAAEEYRSMNGLVLLSCETWVTQWERDHPVRTNRAPVKVGHAPGSAGSGSGSTRVQKTEITGSTALPTPRRRASVAVK